MPDQQNVARKDVAIVIPVHRAVPKAIEVLSLRRCQRVLGGYDKILVSPRGMDTRAYRALLPDIEVRSFDPAFFQSDRGYNRLLRLPLFYDRFSDREHILIYQADCYVFEDRLAEFISHTYDYIGAPWTNFEWLRASSPALGLIPKLDRWLQRVGNGGFSLRRVDVFRDLAGRFRRLAELCDVHEDLFWCQLIARISAKLRLAAFDEALRFSFELEPARCFELTGRMLPFGCHAFERYDFAFWRTVIDADELREAGISC